MDTSSPSHRCPGCQRPLAPGRALGLCPRCLLARAALATEAEPNASPPKVPELAAVAAAFPQLEVLELIGRGGMGVVYRARQKSLNRMVALKLLAPGREQDPAFAERFAKEAQALAALSHPNIVTVHDFGFAATPDGSAGEGFYFLLMEFVDGVNLRQAMQAGRFTPEQALAIVPPVCGALQFAHERGIVHRDIKPENLLLNKDGQIKIADFGIAKMLGTGGKQPLGPAEVAPPDSASNSPGTPPSPTLTAQTAVGTPHYMAPEQRDPAGGADHRADIYSLGVVLYELLTGELPGARLEPPSHRVQIDVRLDEIVLRALATQPELRYATAGEFRTQLDTVAATPSRAPGAVPESSFIPRLLKSASGLLTTPENLNTLEGQFSIHRARGQLLLDEHQLTHVCARGTTVIPLATIRDVSIGQYPLAMNPAGIDLLSVTYDDPGGTKQVYLSPMDGWFAWPSTWNARVADWHAAIRNAVARATGKEPAETPRERVSVPPGHICLRIFLLIAFVTPAFATFLFLNLGKGVVGSGSLVSPFAFIVFMLLGGFFGQRLIGRLFRSSNRNATSAPSPWNRVAGTLMILGALGLGWGLVASRHAQAQAQTEGIVVRLQVAQAQEADFRAQLAEWTRRTTNAPDETQRSQNQFGQARMQRELDDAIQRSQELERTLGQGVPKPDRSGPLLTVLPMLLGGLWLLFRSGGAGPSDRPPRRWMQWLGGGLLVFGLPLGGLGTWMAYQVASDSSWNPAPAEAFFAFAVWIGSAACLLGGLTLLAFARPCSGPSRGGVSAALIALVAILLTGMLFLLKRPEAITPRPPIPGGIGH
ncbi:MAG: serine/threonine protein kinase [Verrucomicrobia bacterium]|nr:serine/threonine protein kinase [Verrucomicrobiota bacterium]